MARSLQIAPSLKLPLDAVTETFGIFGQKGSGKSSTSAVFVEQGVRAGGRFVIADPTGVWWGLMHDGARGPGLPGIVFGGEHADVPLEPTAGHVVAEFVVQQDEYPVVVLDMKLMRKADRTRFMLAFMETLYHDNREALHVVLDESHQFAPTQAREGGDQIKLLGAVEDVVALGRSRGLGITMISQRFATLNANVREQIGTLVAHRLVGSLDRKALKGWIEAQADPAREKEVMDVMAKLKTAQALVWSPAFLDFFGVVEVNAPETFDSRATPKVGQRVKKPGKRAPVNLDVLRDRMAETIEEAERNDPKKLQGELAKVRRELQVMHEQWAARERELESRPAETVTVEVPVITDEQLRQVRDYVLDIERAQTGIDESYEKLREVLYPLASNVKDALDARARPSFERPAPPAPKPPPPPVPPPPPKRPAAPETDEYPKPSEQRILNAIRWFATVGNGAPTKQQVGYMAGYRVGRSIGGGYGNLLSALRTKGLIDYPTPGTVILTDAGMRLALDPDVSPTDEGVQAAVRARLKPAEARVLDVLIEVWPESLSKQEIGARAGYTVGPSVGGGFGNILGRLHNTLGVIEYPSPGLARASDVLFPLRAARAA